MIRRLLRWLHIRTAYMCYGGDTCPCSEAEISYESGYGDGLADGWRQAQDRVDEWHRPLSY